jgi:hypothetical protein
MQGAAHHRQPLFFVSRSNPDLQTCIPHPLEVHLRYSKAGFNGSSQASSQQRHNHLLFGETTMTPFEVILLERPPEIGIPMADRD